MKIAASVLALLVLAANAAGQRPSGAPTDHLVVLSSPDAVGHVSLERLNSCLLQLARDWKLDEHSLPRITVMHVSKQGARVASVNSTLTIRRNRSSDTDDVYYELWLVDAPKLDEYLLGLENILEQHYNLQPTDEKRKEVLQRAARVESATISIYEGK